MLNKIKKAIQDKLYQDCIEEYRNALHCQTDPYLMWIRETERFDNKEEEFYPSLSVICMEQCGEDFDLAALKKDIILFISGNGKIALHTFREVMEYFDTHQDVDLVYGDEDIWFLPQDGDDDPDNELKHRMFPWAKPMWSPDTLFSYLYFGNVFAVRHSALENLKWLGMDDYRLNLYDLALKVTEQGKRAGHIEKILFHKYWKANDKETASEQVMRDMDLIGVGSQYDFIREMAMERRGLKGKMAVDESTGISYPVYEVENSPLVSIIIPSKDNVEILKQCIRSVYQYTTYPNYEIIVVDNGSTAQARMMLQSFQEECAFTYLYEPMDFNFSRMCNLGAQKAKGEYLLLLNDDMEVLSGCSDWMTRMVGQASLRHVGAVGAKLLYPDSNLIQHVGVTNTISGPGHKLKALDDTQAYYYGRNKLIYDMIGVTAACLMMRTRVYKALGGLYEGLKVAYNDVDLCFRICEKGLYNVQRNDVVLYHHESLSRGDDMQDEAKFKRLMEEKDNLYKRHPRLYAQDPFNGTIRNTGAPEYEIRWLEGYEFADLTGYHDEVKESSPLPNMKHVNQAIMIVVEDCGKEKFQKAGSKGKAYYLIKGWAYIPGADNARYKLKLLLQNEHSKVWEIPIVKKYRKDVAAILLDEVNVEMTGFCCWIYEGSLPAGTYELWLTARDSCSRQRLYRSAQKQLIIEE